MGLKEAAMFNAATAGMAKSMQNLVAIQQAKQKTQQETELFDLKKKKLELELEEAEKTNEISSIEKKIRAGIAQEMFKSQKSIIEGQKAQQNMAEETQMNQFKQLKGISTALAKDPAVQDMLLGLSMKSGVGVGTGQPMNRVQPNAQSNTQAVARNINPRLPFANSDMFELTPGASPFDDIEDMVRFKQPERRRDVYYVSDQGAKKVASVPKDAVVIKGVGGQDIELPSSITKESQAVEYLMSTKGLSREEAEQKIKELR